jgi:hypothetical protein
MASIKRQANGSRSDSLKTDDMQSPPSKSLVSVAKYKAYLAQGTKPLSRFANPQNLFDNSNSEDKKWLELTINHLAKVR